MWGVCFTSNALRAEGKVCLSSEHRVVNARHKGCRRGQTFGHGHLELGELLRGVFQIKLIEHAVLMVACQQWPGLGAEMPALCFQSAQVGLCRYVLRAQLFGFFI